MKSEQPEGKRIIDEHNKIKDSLIKALHNRPAILANEIEKLTTITLRRFRALSIWPKFDLGDD